MRLKFNLILLCSFAIAMNRVDCDEPAISSEPRICSFLPNLIEQLAVEPGVPENFVALSAKGDPDVFDWIYWGPKDVLEAYFKDPKSLNQAIIRVKLSPVVVQTAPNEFNGNTEKFVNEVKEAFFGNLTAATCNWGEYPVVAISAPFENREHNLAWVGLNEFESGTTLLFGLEVPDEPGRPNKADKQFWENFLLNTKQLTGKDLYRAHGFDMQPGYTIFSFDKRKLKFSAEKRERDNAIQVVIQPLTPHTEFEYQSMSEGLHGGEWKWKEPLVKVNGVFTINDDHFKFTKPGVMSIFIQNVNEFSDTKLMKDVQVHTIAGEQTSTLNYELEPIKALPDGQRVRFAKLHATGDFHHGDGVMKMRLMNGSTSEFEVSIDKDGSIKKPDSEDKFVLCMAGGYGEAFEYELFTGKNKKETMSIGKCAIIPFPIIRQDGKGRKVELTPESPEGDVFLLTGSGFLPNEKIHYRSRSCDEVIVQDFEASNTGDFNVMSMPGVIGQIEGPFEITLSSANMEPMKIRHLWGKIAFRNPGEFKELLGKYKFPDEK